MRPRPRRSASVGAGSLRDAHVAGLHRDAGPAAVLLDEAQQGADRAGAGPAGCRSAALDSWMCTFGSSVTPSRSLAQSPLTTASPPTPQW